jgi:hypothetical protein
MARGIVMGAGQRTVIQFAHPDNQEEFQEIFGRNAKVTVNVEILDPNQDIQHELHAGREVNATFELGATAQELQDEALGGQAVVQPRQNLPRNSPASPGSPASPNPSLEEASRNSLAAGTGGTSETLPSSRTGTSNANDRGRETTKK